MLAAASVAEIHREQHGAADVGRIRRLADYAERLRRVLRQGQIVSGARTEHQHGKRGARRAEDPGSCWVDAAHLHTLSIADLEGSAWARAQT